MYYQIIYNEVRQQYPHVINIRNGKDLLELDIKKEKGIIKEYFPVKLMTINIRPESLKQSEWRCQSCALTDPDTGISYDFFNRDIFPHLYKILQASKIIIYRRHWGDKQRNIVVGYIDDNGNKIILY